MKIFPRFAIFRLALLVCCLGLTLTAMAQEPDEPGDGVYVGEAKVTFTTIDVPGAVSTNVTGINNLGEMVGSYAPNTSNAAIGFTYIGGVFAYFSYPGRYSTDAGQVNDSGVIVGTAVNDLNFTYFGFLYDGITFTTINVPGQSDTAAAGINNAGDVVGGYGPSGAAHCYELIGKRFKNITPPPGGGFVTAGAGGINNSGSVVGSTEASSATGFLYENAKFRTINVPGSLMTVAYDINDSGLIVGWYESCVPSCAIHGFALINGKYVSLNHPGASETFALGVNNAGQVVGAYMLDNVTHGFVTAPITEDDPKQAESGR